MCTYVCVHVCVRPRPYAHLLPVLHAAAQCCHKITGTYCTGLAATPLEGTCSLLLQGMFPIFVVALTITAFANGFFMAMQVPVSCLPPAIGVYLSG